MRKIFIFFFLLITCYSFSQDTVWCGRNAPATITPKAPDLENAFTGKVVGLKIATTTKGTTQQPIRLMCHCIRTITTSCAPMLIVDGKTHRIDSISLMNPQDFESVEVLKSAAATALFGAEGVNGVIWITTKNSGFRKLIIKDSLDGSPIAGATVLFTSLKDRHEKLQIIANDSGVVITNKLNGPARYRMTVSAVGYITTEQFFESNAGKGKEIFLNRDVVSCGEVILSYISCPRRPINNWFICKVSGINITAAAEKEEQSVASPLEFKVYPNPVQRSGSLNLRFDNAEGKQKIVRVISLDGRILLQQSFTTSWGKNLFQLPTDARWSAGIYFVQLLYENGQVAASEKVIIR